MVIGAIATDAATDVATCWRRLQIGDEMGFSSLTPMGSCDVDGSRCQGQTAIGRQVRTDRRQVDADGGLLVLAGTVLVVAGCEPMG
ncbi:hypothetical protein ACLOJK_027507 [Asimina triloba]